MRYRLGNGRARAAGRRVREWRAQSRNWLNGRAQALRYRLGNGRVHASNAWYRAAGRRLHGWRAQHRNWLNGRARARGKAPLPDRLTRWAGSRTPGYRNRINRATGRPRWTDRNPAAMARWQAARSQGRTGPSAPGRSPARRSPAGRPRTARPRWRAGRTRERSR